MNLKQTLSYLTDAVLLDETVAAAAREKAETLRLLEHLAEVDRRRAYAIEAYSSLYDYVVKRLGYSEGQATERVNAMRLMRSLPSIKTHFESGALNMSSASKIQRHIQAERKLAHALSADQKAELIDQCLHQSKRDVEKILLREASAPVALAMSERVRVVTPERVELKFSIAEKTQEKMERAKELVGMQTLESLFDAALDAYLIQEEKKRKRPSTLPATQQKKSGKRAVAKKGEAGKPIAATFHSEPESSSRYIPVKIKKAIYIRAQNQCEYRSSVNGRRCQSRYALEFDHRIALALGGKTKFENLRLFCPAHNLRAAIEAGLLKFSQDGSPSLSTRTTPADKNPASHLHKSTEPDLPRSRSDSSSE